MQLRPNLLCPWFLCVVLLFSQCVSASGATINDADYRSSFLSDLSFQNGVAGQAPPNWNATPDKIVIDQSVLHGHDASVRITRDEKSQGHFSVITKAIPIDFEGTTVELRGWLKTDTVSGMAGLWIREDGVQRGLQFDNMSSRHLSGTTDWASYSIVLPLHPRAHRLYFGASLYGSGTAWVSGLQLTVDGKSLVDMQPSERRIQDAQRDAETASSSGVAISALSPVQEASLATLGRIWGFLKYHHPAVTSGSKNWDAELFKVMPAVLRSTSATQTNDLLIEWIRALGTVPDCNPCAQVAEANVQLAEDVAWLSDEKVLGAELSKLLVRIYKNRKPGQQHYISLTPRVENPRFDEERSYESVSLPDAGYQLLALFRFWNIIEYWYPYRNVIGSSWDQVLNDSVREFALAADDHAYKRALLRLISSVHDSHANLWSSIDAVPPEGSCSVPAIVRVLESRAVVTEVPETNSALQVGDVVNAIDGQVFQKLVSNWKPFYAASNDASLFRDIARNFFRGACGKVRLSIERNGRQNEVDADRVAMNSIDLNGAHTHDVRGETFQKLGGDIAYLKLSTVRAADVERYVQAASGTKGLIVDIRNYPSEFVVFELGRRLVDRDTPFARFTDADLSNPGQFSWGAEMSLRPTSPHYDGKVIVLVDEDSQSQAEYTAMALRAVPRAVVVGSTTAGADGNVSNIPLPGGLRTAISGIGVFYPDKRPTQRVGIVPDIQVSASRKTVIQRVDEPLERAKKMIESSSSTTQCD